MHDKYNIDTDEYPGDIEIGIKAYEFIPSPTKIDVSWSKLRSLTKDKSIREVEKPMASKEITLKPVTVKFFGYDENNVKYDLTKTFYLEKNTRNAYFDSQIFSAIQNSLKGTNIIKWGVKRGFMGDPCWNEICDATVWDTVDY
jgi:hypothetical protein